VRKRKEEQYTYREAVGAATGVGARSNVIECRRAGRVQEGVQEAERSGACRNELIVEQRNDAREDGRRARGARDELPLLTADDHDVFALGGDVGEGTAALYAGSLDCARRERRRRG
jgi:hypothetical protein